MKDMQEVMQRVLNVRSFIYLVIYLFINGCATVKNHNESSHLYHQKKFKSKSGFSSIVINTFYDDKSKTKVLAAATANGIYFPSKYQDEKILPIVIKTIPDNKYKINIFSPGLRSLKIENLKISKGDSIVINAYLKEDTRPIID
ncbi:hypothetical protein [Tenacibaculum ascidiaceicola]|uniref:hypothetical protein n=1 Tax=Tenacibaculum ascidiaceicola TaxID=1699411 RepID=UPI003CE5959E